MTYFLSFCNKKSGFLCGHYIEWLWPI